MKYRIVKTGMIYSTYIDAYNYALGSGYTNVGMELMRVMGRVTSDDIAQEKFNVAHHYVYGDIVKLVSTFVLSDFDNYLTDVNVMNHSVTFAHVRYPNGKNLIINIKGLERVDLVRLRSVKHKFTCH